MENYFYNTYTDSQKQWFIDNEEALAKTQPDVYEEMVTLAKILNLPITQTLAVNSVTEFSTYCTSIVARTVDGQIAHVRNLDFGFTDTMKTLVYDAVLIRDGKVVAEAPAIAGFMGFYTGHKPGMFSISYNVRETTDYMTDEQVMVNLERQIIPEYTPVEAIIEEMLLYSKSFDYTVEQLSTRKVTSPGFVIVGGTKKN